MRPHPSTDKWNDGLRRILGGQIITSDLASELNVTSEAVRVQLRNAGYVWCPGHWEKPNA